MHQPPDAILRCLIQRDSNEIHISRNTRFQYQTSVSVGITTLLVEIVHCEFGGVNHAEEVDVEYLEVGFSGLFVFVLFGVLGRASVLLKGGLWDFGTKSSFKYLSEIPDRSLRCQHWRLRCQYSCEGILASRL